MKAWLIYDQERAHANSWLINHYRKLAPRHGLDLELIMVEQLRAGLVQEALPDFAIMRCVDMETHKQLEALGVRVFNSSNVSAVANNKATTYEWVRSIGIPVLDFQVIPAGGEAPANTSFPCVVKPVDGHGGASVHLVASASELKCYLERQLGDVVVQELASQPGRDVRVYVLGGRVLAAVERQAPEGDLRANFTLGGSAELIELPADIRAHVDNICTVLPLDFAGIDFLFHEGHAVLGEIEDVVGARMLYQLTDLDVVDAYLGYIVASLRS